MAISYVLLQAKKLLSKTFLSTGFSFREYWAGSFKMGHPV